MDDDLKAVVERLERFAVFWDQDDDAGLEVEDDAHNAGSGGLTSDLRALLSERRKMVEALTLASEAMDEAIQWDKARGFRMPYRVRDPLFAAIDRNKAAALTGSREHG